MKTLKAIALEVAVQTAHPRNAQEVADIAEAVLAAYLAQQEPVAYICPPSSVCSTPLGYSREEVLADGESTDGMIPAYLAPPIKPGFVLLPSKPTPAICEVIRNEHDIYGSAEELYAMIINAASQENKDG